jgi:hypothetical protein
MQSGCRGRLATRPPFKGDQARYRPNLLIQWVVAIKLMFAKCLICRVC